MISIPYGSIKRVYDMLNRIAVSGFQFLMVRLKVFTKHPKLLIILFQFLMVRLKVRPGFFADVLLSISIPYGSIKSSVQVVYSLSPPISIPYGSIKSNLPSLSSSAVYPFQFLMVRLKGLR